MSFYIKQQGVISLLILLFIIITLITLIMGFKFLNQHGQSKLLVDDSALSASKLLIDSQNPNVNTNVCQVAEYSLVQSLPAFVSITDLSCQVQDYPSANPPLAVMLQVTFDDNMTQSSKAAWLPCNNPSQCGSQRYAVIIP